MAKRFRVVRRKRNQVEVIGIDFNAAPRTRWQRELDDLGRNLQTLMAREFSDEKVAGQHLRRNTPEYNAWKRRKGFDPRKGHKTNALQRALAGRRLYNISFVAGGRAFITFIESRLYASVDYAQYYAAAKVQGGKILAVSKRQVARAAKGIEAFAKLAQQDLDVKQAALLRGGVAVAAGGRAASTISSALGGRAPAPTGVTLAELRAVPTSVLQRGMPTQTNVFQGMTTQNRARVSGAVNRLLKIINKNRPHFDAAALERSMRSANRRLR